MSSVLSIFGHRLTTRPPLLRTGALTLIVLATFLIAFAKLHNGPLRAPSPPPPPPLLQKPQGHLLSITAPSPLSLCDTYPDPGNIAIVVLTAATAVHQRLPTLLQTSLACVKQPLLFSDLQQTLGPHIIHDILAEAAATTTTTKDASKKGLELYYEQQRLVSQQRQQELPSLASRQEFEGSAEVLAQLGILRMLGKAWELQPGMDWYVFYESDVFVAWPALVGWLAGLQKGGMRFWGSVPGFSRDGPRGAGLMVLSGRAVEAWVLQEARILPVWEAKVREAKAGELAGGQRLLKKVLQQELRLTVTVAGVLTGGLPSAMPFTQEKWCDSVMSVSNTTARELDAMFQMQGADMKKRLLQRDVYAHFSQKEGVVFSRGRGAWDNLADDPAHAVEPFKGGTTDPHASFEACELACKRADECMQFLFVSTISKAKDGTEGVQGKCSLSKAFRLGAAREAMVGEKVVSMTSGWSPRVENWAHEKMYCPLYGSEE